MGSTTTYYIGAHYQVDNGVITKYYLAGATRIATRKGTTLYYLLSDHASTMLSTSLGSTSLTLNSSGTPSARFAGTSPKSDDLYLESAYKIFLVVFGGGRVGVGETRYREAPCKGTSGTTPTTYQFTSQRNETALGLYFYREASRRDNARWYDPSLGRFTSADTLVPTQTQGVQGWDRFAYTSNNPVRYTDPTGHWRIEDRGSKRGCSDSFYCANGQPYVRAIRPHAASGMSPQSQSSQWALPPLVNPRLGLPRPLTVFDNGLYVSPFGVRVSTQPSITTQTGSPVTLGSDGGVILSGQYGNLSTRLTVNSERRTGFGIVALDEVAENITESTGIIVAPDQLSVTYTSSATVNDVTVTVPVTIDMRYNPHGVILYGIAILAISAPETLPVIGSAISPALR